MLLEVSLGPANEQQPEGPIYFKVFILRYLISNVISAQTYILEAVMCLEADALLLEVSLGPARNQHAVHSHSS